jgi:hypothetical protein
LRTSLASRIAASEEKSLTAPPGSEAGTRTWAERQVLVTIHAHARISALLARPLREIRLGTIAIPCSN